MKIKKAALFLTNKIIDFDKICAKIGFSTPLWLNSYKSILNKEFRCPGFEF